MTPLFVIYVLFLIASGIAMLVIAGIRTNRSVSRRVWSGVLGAGFLIYGLFLLLFFRGGHYVIFYYVFILPILVLVQFFRDRSAFQRQRQAGVFPGQPGGFGQPQGFGQPNAYGQPTLSASHLPTDSRSNRLRTAAAARLRPAAAARLRSATAARLRPAAAAGLRSAARLRTASRLRPAAG